MIWSMDARQVTMSQEMLTSRGVKFQELDLIREDAADLNIDVAGVKYMEIPPAVHDIGRLVVAYAHIGANGILDTREATPFYAVTKRPEASFRPVTLRRAQQTHVLAEHLALSAGIFTEYARAQSESRASRLIPDSYLQGYLDDRLAHLNGLRQEIPRGDLTRRQKATLTHELSYAMGILAAKQRQ